MLGKNYLTRFWQTSLLFLSLVVFCLVLPFGVKAGQGEVLGIHILQPYELDQATHLLKTGDESWHYVTVPISLNDLEKPEEWRQFFRQAKQRKLIPIVRLVTRFEQGAWQVPTKREVVELTAFLNSLEWPTEEKYVIVFNEPNHAHEWSGKVDPESYARVFRFTSMWLRSEGKNYRVLPAAVDLAANNSQKTMEAFAFLDRMKAFDPDIFTYADYWNSHSYPNPGFSSSPERTGQNSVRGFHHELRYLQEATGREFQVFITETGWTSNRATQPWLENYYQYTWQHVWSDPRVIAVTPFLLNGSPGPFAGFSFLDEGGKPTSQYIAYRKLLEQVAEQN